MTVAHAQVHPAPLKIRLVIGGAAVTATLDDVGTTRDLLSLLPLTLELDDLFGREKSGTLPRALIEQGPRTFKYEVGDVVYWPPRQHLSVFYRQDGKTLPAPGMIRLGSVDAGLDALSGPTAVRAAIERVD
jgi:hypothetical protein